MIKEIKITTKDRYTPSRYLLTVDDEVNPPQILSFVSAVWTDAETVANLGSDDRLKEAIAHGGIEELKKLVEDADANIDVHDYSPVNLGEAALAEDASK